MVVHVLSDNNIEKTVELICQKGCKAVWTDIAILEQGEMVEEATGLVATDIVVVVAELKSIMAVYDGTCST